MLNSEYCDDAYVFTCYSIQEKQSQKTNSWKLANGEFGESKLKKNIACVGWMIILFLYGKHKHHTCLDGSLPVRLTL